MSRLGFEPRTRGLKVSVEAVHGIIWRRMAPALRAAAVHWLHRVAPESTAVAVNVAVRPYRRHQILMASESPAQGRRIRSVCRQRDRSLAGHYRAVDGVHSRSSLREAVAGPGMELHLQVSQLA